MELLMWNVAKGLCKQPQGGRRGRGMCRLLNEAQKLKVSLELSHPYSHIYNYVCTLSYSVGKCTKSTGELCLQTYIIIRGGAGMFEEASP